MVSTAGSNAASNFRGALVGAGAEGALRAMAAAMVTGFAVCGVLSLFVRLADAGLDPFADAGLERLDTAGSATAGSVTAGSAVPATEASADGDRGLLSSSMRRFNHLMSPSIDENFSPGDAPPKSFNTRCHTVLIAAYRGRGPVAPCGGCA